MFSLYSVKLCTVNLIRFLPTVVCSDLNILSRLHAFFYITVYFSLLLAKYLDNKPAEMAHSVLNELLRVHSGLLYRPPIQWYMRRGQLC